jgi:hypothetical protein
MRMGKKIVMKTYVLRHHLLKVQESPGLLVSQSTKGNGQDGCGSDTYFFGFCFLQGFCLGFLFVFADLLIIGAQQPLLHQEAIGF